MDDDVDRENAVRVLSEVLHVDRERAEERLRSCGWNLQRAVELGLGGESEANDAPVPNVGVRRRRNARDEGGTSTAATTATGTARRRGDGATRREGGIGNPLSFVAAVGVGIVRAVVKLSVSAIDVALRIALPSEVYARLSSPLLRLAFGERSVTAATHTRRRRQVRGIENDDASEARATEFSAWFSDSFHPEDPTVGIRFMQLSHREALQFARRETKLLFVYLHSPLHHESEVFCSQVLTSPLIAAYVNENFVAWGGNVLDGDARALANGIEPASYPFVAILDSVSGSETSLVMSCEGFTDAPTLIGACDEALNVQNSSLDSARARVAEVDASRRLREEQEAAFAESLARDAAREREVEAKRAQEEAECARVAEEERLATEAKQREEEAERARQEEIESRRVEKTKRLREEPEEGAEGVSKLAIRLPDGSRAERRFRGSDPISDVYDFVDTLEGLDEVRYSLITNFPRRTFGRGEKVSLADCGVHPNGALFVETEK